VSSQQSPQEYFRLILFTVVGQAFGAAGYVLEDRPLRWSQGIYRFATTFHNGLYGFIDYQLLSYADTMYAARQPSRFRVTLTRTNQPAPQTPTTHPAYAQRTISALVVEDFGVAILPDADYWWTFANTTELGAALAEAGHLVIGYGLPWLAGELTPPSDERWGNVC
jgi:hypothetical protein